MGEAELTGRGSSGARTRTRARLGERLVERGLIVRSELERVLRVQRAARGRLGYHLLQTGVLSPEVLSSFLEEELTARRLAAPTPDPAALDVLPARLAHAFNACPLSLEGRRLEVAVPPHHGRGVVERVARATGHQVEACVYPAAVLRDLVERHYLGASAPGVLEPLAGLRTLVIEDDLRGVHPVDAPLRAGDVSAEVWLRSVLAEAIASKSRAVEMIPGPTTCRVTVGAGGNESIHSLDLHARVLARLRSLVSGPDGRFLAAARGRRLLVTARQRATAHGERLVLHLADRPLGCKDLDEAFEPFPQAREGLDGFVTTARSGLLLVVGPDGGGRRLLLAALATRLAGRFEDTVSVSDRDSAGTAFATAELAFGDAEVARAVHAAIESRAELTVVDDLPGARAAERALLASAHGLVVAGLSAADAAGAVAWLARQGVGSALKTGLLRGVLETCALEDACACAAPLELPEWGLDAWGLSEWPAGLVSNAGCDACASRSRVQGWPVVVYRSGDDVAGGTRWREDSGALRRAWLEAGGATLLDVLLRRGRETGRSVGAGARLLLAPLQ